MCVWWVEDTAVLVNTCSTTRTYIELWKHISLIKSGGAAGCREIGGRTPSPPAYEHGWCIPTAVDLVTMVEKLNRPHIFVWQHIQSFSFFGGSLLSPPHCSKKTPTYYTNSYGTRGMGMYDSVSKQREVKKKISRFCVSLYVTGECRESRLESNWAHTNLYTYGRTYPQSNRAPDTCIKWYSVCSSLLSTRTILTHTNTNRRASVRCAVTFRKK